jgi:hypothetical protein
VAIKRSKQSQSVTSGERDFSELMQVIFRQSGRCEAWRLLGKMADEAEDGASRGDLVAMARNAYAKYQFH